MILNDFKPLGLDSYGVKISIDNLSKEEIVESIENEDRDGGYTLTSLGRKIFCVVILPQSSEEQRLAVIDHEKRHIEDDLLEHCSVTCKEASAYLAGYLTRCFYRFTHH